MQEQREDAGEAGVEVGVGLAAPHLEVVDDPPAVEDADHQVAVDRLVEGQVAGLHLAEASEPRGIGLAASLEGGLGEVVEQRVVLGQAELAGADR